MNSENKKIDKLAIFFEILEPKFLESRGDPKSLLITNYAELQKVLNNIKDGNKFKNLFLNVKNLFPILENEIIEVKIEDFQQSLSELFYLDILINIDKDKLNFSYNFKIIQKIHEENKKCRKPLRKLIISKILLDLINNYKQLDNENENNYEKKVTIIFGRCVIKTTFL